MSGTVLVVTDFFPKDFAKAVHGVYQRLLTFAHAFRRLDKRLHFFFFVAADRPADGDTARWAREEIRIHWGIDSSVTLCSAMAPSKIRTSSFWSHYVAPAIRLRSNPDFGVTCGPMQVSALQAALASRPAAVLVQRLAAMLPICMVRGELPSVFLDLDDVEHRKYARSIAHMPSRKGRWLLYAQTPALLLGERAVITRASKTFVCSDVDRAYLTSRLRLDRVFTIPNSVDIQPPCLSGLRDRRFCSSAHSSTCQIASRPNCS